MNYRDLIRPHGQPRSEAVYNSALDFCYSQTGLSRDAADTQAFKVCMKERGYRWLSTKLVRDKAKETKYATTPRGGEQTWQETDEDGTLLTCHSGPGGFGYFCSNLE